MTFRDVKKGDWIIDTKCRDSRLWYVHEKWNGRILIRRGPKTGNLVALAKRQLREFKKAEA